MYCEIKQFKMTYAQLVEYKIQRNKQINYYLMMRPTSINAQLKMKLT